MVKNCENASRLTRASLALWAVTLLFWAINLIVYPQSFNTRDCMHHTFLLTGTATWFVMTQCLLIAAYPEWFSKVFRLPVERLWKTHRRLGWAVLGLLLSHMIIAPTVLFWPVTTVPVMQDHDMTSIWMAIWIWLHPIAGFSALVIAFFVFRLFFQSDKKRRGMLQWRQWESSHRTWGWIYIALIPHVLRCLRENEMLMPIGLLITGVSLAGACAAVKIVRQKNRG